MAPTTKSTTTLSINPQTITPLERSLGLLCVALFITIWLASAISPLLLLLSLYHKYHITTTLILLTTLASHSPWQKGYISDKLTRFLRYYHPRYYNGVTVTYDGELPDAESHSQTFYAIHPHGAFCIGWSILFTSPEMSHVRFCFAPTLYLSPFFRLFSRCAGDPGSAARFDMIQYMENKEDLALPPGGFEEATLTSPKVDRVYIKRRTGFVKLCLRYGIAIRPVYAFGENKLFANLQGFWKIRFALNRMGIPTLFAWGRWFFPLLPRNDRSNGMYIAVGQPVVLPKIENPTKEEVALWHGRYVMALQRLYEDHKEKALGVEEGKVAKLDIW